MNPEMDVGAAYACPANVDNYIVGRLDGWDRSVFEFDAVLFFEDEGEVLL